MNRSMPSLPEPTGPAAVEAAPTVAPSTEPVHFPWHDDVADGTPWTNPHEVEAKLREWVAEHGMCEAPGEGLLIHHLARLVAIEAELRLDKASPEWANQSRAEKRQFNKEILANLREQRSIFAALGWLERRGALAPPDEPPILRYIREGHTEG